MHETFFSTTLIIFIFKNLNGICDALFNDINSDRFMFCKNKLEKNIFYAIKRGLIKLSYLFNSIQKSFSNLFTVYWQRMNVFIDKDA